jgi:peptidoglycan/xylan/chitin deacetylase (PgdA/CDA1 family)
MMNKFVRIFIIVTIVFLTFACSSDDVLEKEQVVEDVEMVTEETTENEAEPEASIIDESEIESKIEQVERVPRYILQSDHTVKPIDGLGDQQVVLLTIDDAPNRYSVEMANLLKEKDINAIFFVNGHFINDEAGREKLKTIYELGFEIGNHTMNHPNLKNLSEDKQRQEIIELNDLIEEITGERPRFFRAPFGVNTEVSKLVVAEESMQWMNWTYGYDFNKEYMEKDALADIMVNTTLLRPGANLLMHDHPWTLEALPDIIEGLKEKGYDFVDPKEIE